MENFSRAAYTHVALSRLQAPKELPGTARNLITAYKLHQCSRNLDAAPFSSDWK